MLFVNQIKSIRIWKFNLNEEIQTSLLIEYRQCYSYGSTIIKPALIGLMRKTNNTLYLKKKCIMYFLGVLATMFRILTIRASVKNTNYKKIYLYH